MNEETVLDIRSERNLATLVPKAQEVFRTFLIRSRDAMLPYKVKLICGSRTFEEQDALYAQGRTTPGDIRTHARGGWSWHNYKLAGDIGIFNYEGQYIDDVMVQHEVDEIYKAAGELAETFGLEWGGRWPGAKCDMPHLQYNPDHLTMEDARRTVLNGGTLYA